MEKKIKISAVIITYNEEKNIHRCLSSIQEVADEIVVIDSYSTDKTKEICEKHKVKFIEHKFDGHIEQKNWAITQAKYNYVLSLDADEALTRELKESILKIKNNWKYDGYSFNRLTYYCGHWVKHCGWYPDQKLRLWDITKGRWGGVNPHDTFIMKEGATTKHIKGDLLHYSYYSINQHINQVNYFTDIAAKAYFEKGRRSNLGYILFSPMLKFFKSYFIKLGFLDGFYGFVISIISSHETFLKYVKLRVIQKNKI